MRLTIIKLVSIFFLFGCTTLFGQNQEVSKIPFSTPSIGVKTNFLYDLTSTINLGVEFKVSPRYTLETSVNYNPWTFSGDKKLKHLLVQPELRYWLCEPFNGHFLGLHGIYGIYNIGGIDLPLVGKQKLEDTRYQGDMFGAGLSYGYQWYLSPRWNLEATLGVGYVHLNYKAYQCKTCGQELYRKHKNYLGPTKVWLSLIYIIK